MDENDLVTVRLPRNLVNLLRVHVAATQEEFENTCQDHYEMTGEQATSAVDAIVLALIPPPAKRSMEAAIYLVPTTPETWAVEAIGSDQTGQHMAFFSGPDAEARAVAYADRTFCKSVRLNHAPSR